MDEYQKAKGIWPHAPEIDSDIEHVRKVLAEIASLLSKAEAALDAQDYASAIQAAEEVLKIQPGNTNAKKGADKAKGLLDQLNAALKDGEEALTRKDIKDAEDAFGRAHKVQEKNPDAIKGLKTAQSIYEKCSQLLKEAQNAAEAGDHKKVVELCSDILLNHNRQDGAAQALFNEHIVFVPPDGTVAVADSTFDMGLSENDFERAAAIFPDLNQAEVRDEMPQHKVGVAPFFIGIHEVTNSEFAEFLNKEPENETYITLDEHAGIEKQRATFSVRKGMEKYPVVNVSWDGAKAYCKWMTENSSYYVFDVPTEAQWERAASWTDEPVTKRLFLWGDKWEANSANCHSRGPEPVGSYEEDKSALGCMDMGGNVSEWCADWYGSDYYEHGPNENPQGPSDGLTKVVRGGSWLNNSVAARTTARQRMHPGERRSNVGFRVVARPRAGENRVGPSP